MKDENLGYSLIVTNDATKESAEHLFLKPMTLYIPENAAHAVNELVKQLTTLAQSEQGFTLTVTNNNNGVSVDKTFTALVELIDPVNAADKVKDLINTVRAYESDEEMNICGW